MYNSSKEVVNDIGQTNVHSKVKFSKEEDAYSKQAWQGKPVTNPSRSRI